MGLNSIIIKNLKKIHMKKIALLSIIGLLLFSCSKDGKTNAISSNRTSENNCDCSESDARRIANSMVSEIEKSQFDVASENLVDVRVDDIRKNSDCSYSATFKIQNNGERVAGWNSAQTITKTITCH